MAIKNDRVRISKQTLQLETVDRIVLDILKHREIKKLLQTAMNRAVKLVGGVGGGIYLWDEMSKAFTLGAESGLSPALMKDGFEKNGGVIGVVRKTKRPYSINNYYQWTRRQKSLDKYHLTAVVASPIISGRKFLGVVVVHHNRDGKVFGAPEEKLLQGFASYSAVAIENSTAYFKEHELNKYLNGIISSTADGIVAVDNKGIIRLYNKSAEQICGYSQDEVMNQRTRVDMIYGSLKLAQDINSKLFKRDSFENYETTIRDKNGQDIPIIISASLLKDHRNKHFGSVGFFKDLRPLRNIVETLKAVGDARELSDSLNILAEGMTRGLNTTFCSILLFKEHGRSLKIEAAYPVFRKKPEEPVKWNPLVGKKVNIDSTSPFTHIYKDVNLHVFRKGEVFEDVEVVSYVQDIVSFKSKLESVLLVPLRGYQDVLGICILGETRKWDRNPFTEEKMALADSFARQGGSFIDRMQLQLREALLATGKDITSLEELPQKLQNICDRMKDALNCDSVILYTFDESKEQVAFPPTRSGNLNHPDALETLKYVSKKSVVWKILESRTPHFADDATRDSWMVLSEAERHVGVLPFVLREKISSSAGIPLMVGMERVGILFVNYSASHTFIEPERADIEIFAVEIATAIQNARQLIFKQHHVDQLEAIRRVSDATNSTLVLNEIYKRALVEMLNVFGLDQGSIVIFNSQDGHGYTVAEHPEFMGPSIPIPLKGNAAIEWILANKQPLLITEDTNNSMLNSFRDSVNRRGVTSMILIPLIVGENLVGTIGLDALHASRKFSDDELELSKTMANLVATAIQKVQSLEEINAVQTVNSTYWLLSRWAHKVRQKTFALGEDLNTLKKDLPIGLYGEILNNMTQCISELNTPVQTIFEEAERENEQILNLGTLLADSADKLHRNKKIVIDLELITDEGCLVKGNRLFLEFAIEFIIENAIRSMEGKEKPGKLSVECHNLGENIHASISDSGEGIDLDVQKILFREPVNSDKGLGYGAYTTANILRAYKGDIRIARTSDEGSRIELWLPAIKN